jgi:hypothetical protein
MKEEDVGDGAARVCLINPSSFIPHPLFFMSLLLADAALR